MQQFSIPKAIKENATYTFCPGCDHGLAIRLIAELIDEFNLKEKTLTPASVGCSVFLYDFLNVGITKTNVSSFSFKKFFIFDSQSSNSKS